jgi:hypothetical protein
MCYSATAWIQLIWSQSDGDIIRAPLKQLSPVKFNYKTEDAKKVPIGSIVQDVPELVASTDRKGVSFSDIVSILTRVVKDQQKTIKTLVKKSHMLESAATGADC